MLQSSRGHSQRALLPFHFAPCCHISGLDQGPWAKGFWLLYLAGRPALRRTKSNLLCQKPRICSPLLVRTPFPALQYHQISLATEAKASYALSNKTIQKVPCGELGTTSNLHPRGQAARNITKGLPSKLSSCPQHTGATGPRGCQYPVPSLS